MMTRSHIRSHIRSHTRSHTGRHLAATLPRFALLVAALLAPLAAMQSLAAGSGTFIEDSRKIASGAGIVLVVGLQRG